MRRDMRGLVIVGAALLALGGASIAAQVQLDRTLSRVYGRAVMSSDVRQAKLLRLVPDATTDDAIQTALENRLLILRETEKNDRLEPARELIDAAKDSWRRGWPAGTDLPALMARAGMTDQTLDGWFRDELRINSYLSLRFGQVADRANRIASWVNDLRRRANLQITRS